MDFTTDAKFDNPRAVQVRLSAFDFDRLCDVGRKVRDVYAMHANAPERLAAKAGDAYIDELARAVAGRLGGKVGVAPRIFLKKLVADILDRIDQFPDFDPHQHYKLTIQDTELTATERQAASATSVDDIDTDVRSLPVAAFDLLHPGLQHHVVNSLGWRELRPFQEEVIPVVLRGEHVVVIAPTAGGKTEAAVLPILSRMLSEDWRGLSVLYLCPIRALLNNLHIRLSRYATLVGRSCSVWHGDTSPTERARINREQPDILLTTPESLEVMLVSRKTDPVALFAQVRAVIVDELHAFAGDDRGWHMLSVLQRVSRLAGRELQRIGLSATVGNPEQLLRWLVSGSTMSRSGRATTGSRHKGVDGPTGLRGLTQECGSRHIPAAPGRKTPGVR